MLKHHIPILHHTVPASACDSCIPKKHKVLLWY